MGLTLAGAHCPMCGSELEVQVDRDVQVDSDDRVLLRCLDVGCKRPLAANEVLADPETEHIVIFDAQGFSIQHPLRERLDGELFTCGLHRHIRMLNVHPAGRLERFRVSTVAGRWHFEPQL